MRLIKIRVLPRIYKRCILSIILTIMAALFITVNLLTLKRDVSLRTNCSHGLYVLGSHHTGPKDIANLSEFPLNNVSFISEELPQFIPGFNETESN